MLSIPTRYVNTHTLIYQQQTTCQITSSVIISVLSAYVFIDVTALDLFYLHIDFFFNSTCITIYANYSLYLWKYQNIKLIELSRYI